MAAAVAWVLNLDADLELAAAARYTPTRRTLTAMKPHVATLARTLLSPDDVLIDERTDRFAEGLVGRAFSPTPRALELLRRAGALPEAHPPLDVLRRVNSRAFCSALGPTLPGAAFVTELDVARAMLDGEPALGGGFRLKRAFGLSGRGQRVVAPAAIAEADLAFLHAALAEGGVQIEPNAAIETEWAMHGFIEKTGTIRLGALVRQRCDARGAWLATERADDVGSLGELPRRLAEETERVAHALIDAGYFGPFGVDAFTYRDRLGALCLQPRSEINARYSMGFPIGFPRS